ncbi:PDZ domain-containing protein [Cynara cardunculus var. scolymus]|uniref:PDZ domain-containing protein n=1 Tax=Cynara cardunculus var. scolymus TaxID=59895 RepID=A0A118JV22_CYNCS|nr:PDZ domain-containing protein [Cynara cardunculus var. scolymus]
MEDSSERLESEPSEMKDELSMEIDPPFNENHATAEDWRKALHKVVPAVVVLRTTACRAFDTESAGASYATGFVVDKRRGIILTNRHVVKPGPVVAEAMFVNREEIPVYPIYRDPVHDFGFFRYDPAAIQFLSYEEIPLAPEAACVGLEIRVVGNDSGEKAASGTKGGSSGSPVIDWQGRAIALNAGSKTSSASAFFFPLERVVRALNFLQKGRDSCQGKWEAVTIPRGTLQATFLHKGFDETRRLGLQSETEQLVRHASPLSETGMLVVDSVVPGGPAYKHMEPGDVLVRMNGEVITQFLRMETSLDDSVGQNVELEFERGGRPFTVQLMVQDLHSITPNYFLEVSGAVIHPLSYQQARNFRFHCGLVYVSEPGYMLFRAGVPRHAIIKKFAGEDISHLEDFVNVLSKLSRGARVPLEYISYLDRHRKKSVLVTVDRHEWYAPPQIYTRDDNSGIWIGKQALLPNSQLISSGIKVIEQGLTSNIVLENRLVEPLHQDIGEELVNGVASMDTSSSDHVTDEPHVQEESDNGTKKRRVEEDLSADGIVIADLNGLPQFEQLEDPRSPGDTVVRDEHGTSADSGNASVAERVIEPTLVMFESSGPTFTDMCLLSLHPLFSTYGPSESDLALTNLNFHYVIEPALHRGETVYLVGLSRSLQATSRKSVVTNPFAALNISSADSPRYRATNMEVIELDTDFGSSFSGVLTDEHGRVKAIWGSFSTQVLKKIISGTEAPSLLINGIKRPMPLVRILEVELYPTLLSKARSFGLSNNWIQALAKKDPVRRQVLRVKGCLAGSKAENLLEQGDMVLAINKKPVTCFHDFEDACHALDLSDGMEEKLGLTIFRQGREIELLVGTDIRDGNGTTRDPHPAVRALGWSHGSPVHRYGLYALQWIVEVNGKPTPDLDAFVNVTKEINDGEFVRVKTVHLNGKPRVLTLKQDLHYWPTWELRFDPETAMWQRKTIKSLGTGNSP